MTLYCNSHQTHLEEINT